MSRTSEIRISKMRYFLVPLLVSFSAHAQIRLVETGGAQTNYVGLQAPAAVTGNFTLSLPSADGSANQCLATNGAGALQWRSTGSSNSLDASDGSPTNAVYVDAVGNVGIGTTVPVVNLDVVKTDQNTVLRVVNLDSTAARTPGIQVVNFLATGTGGFPTFTMANYRGTSATPTATQSGDLLGYMSANGYTGSAPASGTAIASVASAVWTGASAPADFLFYTTTSGQTAATEKMRIMQSGNVGIGTSTPQTALDVNGGVAANSSYEGISAYVNTNAAYVIPDTTMNIRRLTLNNSATITLPAFTSPTSKIFALTLFLKQDATGSRTITWAGNGSDTIKWDNNVAPTISPTNGKITIIQLMKPSDETVWYGSMTWKEN